MNKTKIEWVKNPDGTQGYTWNPITGCLNGCEYCYARRLANGRLKARYLANDNMSIKSVPDKTPRAYHYNECWAAREQDPFFPRFWIEKRLSGGSPKGIFVCDMSDLFGIGIPKDWTKKVLDEMMIYKQHRFYLLTKQPQNLMKFSPFLDNCWVGVTATDHFMYKKAIRALSEIEAKKTYISFEPLLHRIDVEAEPLHDHQVSWVIIGSQTNPYKPPKIEWVEEIVDACDKAGIPVFLKDNLNPMFAENDCKLFKEHRDTLFTFKDFEPDSNTRWHLRQEMRLR